jgi:cell division GTPase FtsZ
MAKRHSMRDGPLAQLFKATERSEATAARREAEPEPVPTRPQVVDLPAGDEFGSTHVPRQSGSPYLAVIRVVGVGGGGCNAVKRMIEAGIEGVEFIAVNTDQQQMQMSEAPVKINIGRERTQGLGSGADPEVGRLSAEDS